VLGFGVLEGVVETEGVHPRCCHPDGEVLGEDAELHRNGWVVGPLPPELQSADAFIIG